MDKINYNNYLLNENSNLKRRQPRPFQALKNQTRDKTPTFTRVRNQLNQENNNNISYPNSNYIIQNNNVPRERNNYRFISSNRQYREEYEPLQRSNTSNNTLSNNVMNKNKNINLLNNTNDPNNHSVNYTMRDSIYSNFSGSAFTNKTYNDLNSKYNYYKVLFHQLKGHNLALLNQIKKDKDLNDVIKTLEKENLRLKNENQKLKENNNIHANSKNGEEEESNENCENINEKDDKNNDSKRLQMNKKQIIEYLNDIKDDKNKIKKFNKTELISIVENLQNTNEDQKNELINLYNKLINQDDDNDSNNNDMNNKIKLKSGEVKGKDLQKLIDDLLLKNKNLVEDINNKGVKEKELQNQIQIFLSEIYFQNIFKN